MELKYRPSPANNLIVESSSQPIVITVPTDNSNITEPSNHSISHISPFPILPSLTTANSIYDPNPMDNPLPSILSTPAKMSIVSSNLEYSKAVKL